MREDHAPLSQCRPFCLRSICSKMPRADIWGPLCYQCLGMHHLWTTTQGVEHLLAILRPATCPTLTGQLIRTTMVTKCNRRLAFLPRFHATHMRPTALLLPAHGSPKPGACSQSQRLRGWILSTSLSSLALKIPFSWNDFR